MTLLSILSATHAIRVERTDIINACWLWLHHNTSRTSRTIPIDIRLHVWGRSCFSRFPAAWQDSVELWLDHADEYVKGKQRGRFSFFAKSSTFYDFGFDNWNESENYISNTIPQTHSMFDLVLVFDHTLESLVLLSDLMNWSLNDVACMQINSQAHKNSLNATDKARVREKVRRWNKADAALFDYFNATSWKKLKGMEVAGWRRL